MPTSSGRLQDNSKYQSMFQMGTNFANQAVPTYSTTPSMADAIDYAGRFASGNTNQPVFGNVPKVRAPTPVVNAPVARTTARPAFSLPATAPTSSNPALGQPASLYSGDMGSLADYGLSSNPIGMGDVASRVGMGAPNYALGAGSLGAGNIASMGGVDALVPKGSMFDSLSAFGSGLVDKLPGKDFWFDSTDKEGIKTGGALAPIMGAITGFGNLWGANKGYEAMSRQNDAAMKFGTANLNNSVAQYNNEQGLRAERVKRQTGETMKYTPLTGI